MPHFYVKPENISNNIFVINEEQAHYIATVRRFNINDQIMIFDGLGNSYTGKITALSKGHIEGNILSSSYKMPQHTITLYTAIPKGDRFEWLIEKAGELGISAIIPINTKRSVNTSFSKNKMERFEKISLAASSQCGRNDIMKIHEPFNFADGVKKAAAEKNSVNILPWESAEKEDSLQDTVLKCGRANIFIGPEGGFENEEVDFAKSLGAQTITLGSNILRIETAAITAGILILNAFGVLGQSK